MTRVYLLLFLLLTSRQGFSQRELTLEECIRIALANSHTIEKSQNSVEAQSSVIKSKYGALLPTLSFNTGWTRTNQVYQPGTIFVGGIPIVTGGRDTTTDNFNLQLRTDVLLFNGFSNYESIDYAKLTRRSLQYQLEDLRRDIVIKVITDYITVLKNQQVLTINTATLEDSKAQLERVKVFVEVGKRAVVDIYRQDADVAQKELLVEQAKNSLNKSISDLVFDMNLSQDAAYTIRDEKIRTDLGLDEMQHYVAKNSNVGALVQTAYRNRYDYKAAETNIEITRTNVEINRSLLLFPTLSGFSSYSMSGDRINKLNNQRVFTLGLTLSYPIFQGFQTQTLKEQAEVNLRSSKEDLDQIKSQINLEVTKATLDLNSYVKQIEISERSIKATEQEKFAAEEQYKVGIGTLLDVQIALTRYNNALIDKSNSVYNFILAQKVLEYYQGILRY
jgi:outer membrane protein